MAIKGNRTSTTYEAKRAGLPQVEIKQQNVKLIGDGTVWPCGLLLHKEALGWDPYTGTDTGLLAVLDEETDTAEADSALVTRFGAVKKDELLVNPATPAAPADVDLDKLEAQNIYPI